MSSATPDKATQRAALEDVDRDDENRPAFLLSLIEVKLLGIAGVSVPIRSRKSSGHVTAECGGNDCVIILHQ